MAIRGRAIGVTILLLFSLSWRGIGASQGLAPSQRHGGLLLKDFQVPKGARVVGYEIHLVGGAFESITDIPNGWHVAFENDPSWKASFDAHAKPGAAALDEKALRSIWLQITRNEVGDTQFNVWGSLTVASNLGVEKEVPLSSFSFDFIERYSRHRLY